MAKDGDRLFSGAFSGGIVWADRHTERHGDYKRLAFLSYGTLELEFAADCPPDLKARIEGDAAAVQARKGEEFQVSASGQAVTLGSRTAAPAPRM